MNELDQLNTKELQLLVDAIGAARFAILHQVWPADISNNPENFFTLREQITEYITKKADALTALEFKVRVFLNSRQQ